MQDESQRKTVEMDNFYRALASMRVVFDLFAPVAQSYAEQLFDKTCRGKGAPPPFDVVAKFHRYNITRCNKANTKRAHWCDPARGPWELAKFLIRDDIREGREKTRASETDISQIVNFLQYCKLVEWPNCRHHLAELQTRRNRLLHLGSQRLKEADYKQTIDTLTTTVKSLTLAEFKPRVAETLDKLKQATQRTFFSLQDREELVLNESPFLQDLQPLLPRKRYCCPSPELFECVRNTLTSNTPVKRNVLLWGMSAVGKSSLASAVVADQSVRDKFSNRIRWVSLKPPTSVVEPNFRPARLLHKLARSVGAPKADDDQDSIKHSAFYLKKYLSDRPILIVVDGAWDAALISPLVAIGPHCRILVTSTLRLTLPAKSFTTLTLTPPDAKHAREIFLRALAVDKNDIDDDDGDEIDGFRHSHAHSHLCQPPPECVEKILSVMSSPLSLSMLGKQLRHAPREDWEEAVRRLCDTDSPPSEKVDEGRLFPLIQQCLDSMQPNNAQLCGTIRECYLALGVFPKATPIPLSLLSTLWSDENQTLSVGHTIVANLERASLATCDATSLYLYQLHHDYAASECRKAGRIVEWHNRIANAYRAQYEKCTVNCWSPDDYFADHLVYHLIHGEQSAVAFDLLCSFDWIHFRICVGGTGSLFGPIDDCDRLLDLPKSSLDDTQHAHVALLRRTLRLMVGVEWSSPENPQELALQLYGRLQTRSTANQHTQRLCRELYAALNHASLPLSILPACESDPFLETADGAVDAVLRGHDAIRVIAVVPGGRYALSGGDDANVCVWDLAHFSLMGTLKGHESPVTALTAPAHTDGTPLRVMSGDKDGFIRVWDATLCTTLFTLRVYRSREVSALAVSSTGHQLASGCAGAIELWNLCDDVSPDGSISTDDESDRRRIHMLGESSTTRVLLVRWLAYTHGDARLLSGGSFDTLSEKADERVAVREWCLDMVPSGMNFQMHLEPYSVILAVAVAEQVVLPSGLQGVLVAATDDKGELHVVNERPLVLSQDHTHISAMTLTPNGQCVVCGIQNELLVLKRSTSSAAFAPVATLYGHSDIATGCAAINNDCVLSCSLDSTLRVWSLHRQPHLQRPRVEALAIMEYPGMYRILLSKSDGCGEILCYAPTSDAASQPTTLRPRSHFECVTCIVVAGESHSFASCDMQGNICLWKAVLSAENFTPFKNFKVPRDTDCLALSPLGEYLVWAVEKDVRVCRVDEPPSSVPAVRAWHNKSVSALSVALASDRTTNRIFTAYKGKQGTVVVWSVSLAEPECVFKLGSRIDSVATTLSGEYVVFGCDKVAHVYRYAETVGASTAAEAMLSESYQFVPQRRLEGHTKSLTRIAVVSEKRKGTVRAVTGSDDNTVRVWDALTGEQLALVPVHGQARLLSFSTSLLVVAPERGFFPFAVGCPVKVLRDWDDDDDVFDDCANFSPVTPVPASLGDTPSRRSSSTFVDMVRSRRSSTTSNFSEST